MLPVMELNWWAILAAAMVYFAIGAFWFSPSLFGRRWARSIGMDMDKMKRPKPSVMARTYAIAFITSFIMIFVLSIFIHVFNTASIGDAMQIGLLMWLGFVVTDKMTGVLFEGRNAKYFMITSMHSFVGILAAAAILAAWF